MLGWLKITFIIAVSCGFSLGCSESSFNGSQSKSGDDKPPTKPNKDVFDPSGDSTMADKPPGFDSSVPHTSDSLVQKFTQQNQFVVDIVFVFDTSKSMKEEKDFVEQNMLNFMTNLSSAHLDPTVTVIGKVTAKTDPMNHGLKFVFPNTLPAGKFAQVDQYVHSTDAIGHLGRYIKGSLATPMPLRKDVPLEVVIVSDDNGHNTDNNPYGTKKNTAAEFEMPKNLRMTINAVVGLEKGLSPTNPGCEIENVGTEHMDLANKTGGTVFDLCNDWNAMLKELTDKIVARNTGFVLEKTPDTSKDFQVYINGKLVSAVNYTIDVLKKLVKFKDTYIVPVGAQVEVRYVPQKA